MKKIYTILAVALFVTLAYGAADFSGTWTLDTEESDSMMMGRRGGAGQGGDIQITLVIDQTENELNIHRTMMMGGNEQASDMKYTLDGKENTNTAAMGRGEIKSKANWEGDKLVIEGVQTMSSQRGNFEIATKEEYSLSADGKVLNIVTTRSGQPGGGMTTTQVYNKK